MLSQTKYKLIYAAYSFGISILLFGALYMNFIRLYPSLAVFGLDKVQKRNLIEVSIISAIIIVVCLFGIIQIGVLPSLWKIIYGVVPAAIIFMVEFFMIVFFRQLPYGRITIAKLFSSIGLPCLCMLFAVLLAGWILLNRLSGINILSDEDSEVVSAILIPNIAVMAVTIVSYAFLC